MEYSDALNLEAIDDPLELAVLLDMGIALIPVRTEIGPFEVTETSDNSQKVGQELLACLEAQMRGCLPQPREPGALESP